MKNICLVAVLCVLIAPRGVLALDEEDGIMSAPTPGSAPRLIELPSSDLEPERKAKKTGAVTAEEEAAHSKDLAADFGVVQKKIIAMREQEGMTWQEIQSSLQVARFMAASSASPMTMEEALRQVQDLRARGMTYSAIAQRLGGSFSSIKQEGAGATSASAGPTSQAQSTGRGRVDNTPDRPDRPAVAERPEGPARPD